MDGGNMSTPRLDWIDCVKVAVVRRGTTAA